MENVTWSKKMVKFSHQNLEQDYYFREELLNDFTSKKLTKLIDSTLLKQNIAKSQIDKLCQEAISFDFRAVCLPPCFVQQAKKLIENSSVQLCTVVAFPLGFQTLETKIYEIENALINGAEEIDFVQNVSLVKEENWSELKLEYQTVVHAAKDKLVKVILETALLTEEEIFQCSYLAASSGIHIVKTSTGFASRGALLSDIKIMRAALNKFQQETGIYVGIKASGGVRNNHDALQFIREGAIRIGTSSGIDIVNQRESTTNY
jgi:deoxyribose-phosphate aldolase